MANEKKHEEKKYEKKPYVGAEVLYWHQQAQSVGADQLIPYAARICGITSKASNFQEKDMAVDLRAYPAAGGSGEMQRSGVMFSIKPQNGRWTWNAAHEEYLRNVTKDPI